MAAGVENYLDISPHMQDVLFSFTQKYIVENPDDSSAGMNFLDKIKKPEEASNPAEREDKKTDVSITELPKTEFKKRRYSVASELFNVKSAESAVFRKIEKSPVLHNRISHIIAKIYLFKIFDEEQLSTLVDCFYSKNVKSGEFIYREREAATTFYLVELGSFKRFIKNKLVQILKANTCFGKMALMHNVNRNSTIIAETNGKLWAIDRSTFSRLTAQINLLKLQQHENILCNVPLLNILSDFEQKLIVEDITKITFGKDDIIYSENEESNGMYFIEEGEVGIYRDVDSEEQEIDKRKEHEYFGILDLKLDETEQKRKTKAVALSDVVVTYFLNNVTINNVLGSYLIPVKSIIKDS